MCVIFRILGCGSSGGVPRIDGNWGECDPTNLKNRRSRCSLLVTKTSSKGKTRILIDTSPDMREQLVKAKIKHLDAILFTHDHADQTHGIDDVRALVYAMRKRIPAWMDASTAATLKTRFGYCFEQQEGSNYPAILQSNIISPSFEPITISGAGGDLNVLPFMQDHGAITSLGFRIGGIAYSSDVSNLPPASYPTLANLDCWIVDALRREPHPTHFHLEKTLQMIEIMKPKRAVLTNLHIDLDYETLRRELPKHICPAFDGMQITR